MKKELKPIIKSIKKFYFKQSRLSKFLFWTFLILLTVYAGILILAWLGMGISIFSLFYNNFLKTLGFDLKTPFLLFVLIAGVTIPITIFLLRKTNKFVIIAFYLMLFLFIFGVCLINQIYTPELPSEIPWRVINQEDNKLFWATPNCSISKLNCKSFQDKENFVIGDEILCSFDINRSCSLPLKKVSIIKFLLNNETILEDEGEVTPDQSYLKFEVDERVYEIAVYPEFYNNSEPLYAFTSSIELNNKYSPEDYNQKKIKERYEKTALLISLISLSLLSVTIAMNNLRQLSKKDVSQS